MISSELIRRRIRSYREQKNLSTLYMAEKLHMDERNYKRIESGEKKNLELSLVDSIADLLEVDFTELITAVPITIKTIKDNIVGFANKEVTLNGISDDMKTHYEKIIAELRHLNETQAKLIETLMEMTQK